MSTFKTRHQGLAAVLLYTLGAVSHVRTFTDPPKGAVFEFADPNNECSAIASRFFDDHGEGGFAIADARALLDTFRYIKRTLSAAINEGGTWENECLQPE